MHVQMCAMTKTAAELKRVKKSCASSKCRLKKKGLAMRNAIAKGALSHGKAADSLAKYLAVAKSSIDGAGMGVFASRDFKANMPIIHCTGQYLPARGQSLHEQKYSFIVHGHPRFSLCGVDDAHTNIIKYVNSDFRTELTANVCISWHGCLPMLYAKVPITEGTELLLDYKF